MTAFANAIDKLRGRHYLVANTYEEIEKHCSDLDLTITSRPNYVDSVMVCYYFIWVGEGSRPAKWKISKPPKKKTLLKE